MNRSLGSPVVPVAARACRVTGCALLGLIGCLSTLHTGCVAIDGGAIELSWSLVTTAGEPVSCADAGVAEMQLNWNIENDGVGFTRFQTFPCDPPHAATRFDIPTGTASMWVVPICKGGAPADSASYQAPAPISRVVIEGEVVTLNALLVVVRTDCSGAEPCICPP